VIAAACQATGLDADQSGQLWLEPPAGLLLAAADNARIAGHRQATTDALLDALDGATAPGTTLLMLAMLRSNDGEFEGHGVDGLRIRRVEYVSMPVTVGDFELELVATASGAFILKSIRSAELGLVTVAGDLQLFGGNEDNGKAAEVHARGFDYTDLERTMQAWYELRLIRRLAWGFGCCLLTDQRLVGLIYEPDTRSGAKTPERDAMPDVLCGDGPGSVVVFDAERRLFEKCEIQQTVLSKRVPTLSLMGRGDCCLVLSTSRILNDDDRLVRPGKGIVADAVQTFLSTDAATRQDGGSGQQSGAAVFDPATASLDQRASRRSVATTLARLGFLPAEAVDEDNATVEILASLLPPGSTICVCVTYGDVTSTGRYPFREARGRFPRALPPAPLGGHFGLTISADGLAEALRTHVVLCTQDLLLWTTSRLATADGVVAEEDVTAYWIALSDIEGARLRRRGLDIWVNDGPTLSFRATPTEASVLCTHLETAAASHYREPGGAQP